MASYTIIGGDNKEYGPISVEDIRQWISEGRLSPQSPIKSDADTAWRTLGTLPEFADAFKSGAAAPPPLTSLTGTATGTNDPSWQAELEARPPELRLGECLGAGFSFLSSNAGFVIGASVLTWLMMTFLTGCAAFIPILGGIILLCFKGVVMGGFYLACLRRMRGENAGPGAVFSGFTGAFGQLLLAGLVSVLLCELGVCACVLPAIYLGVAWVFAVPLVADKKMFFWSAMELSRKVVTKVWFEVFALLIVAFLPILIAQIINGVISGTYFYNLYQTNGGDFQQFMQSLQTQTSEIRMLTVKSLAVVQVVTLVNFLYFGGVMMRAYENLFGSRKR